MKANGPVTASELVAMLENDEDYQQRKRQRDLELAEIAKERARKLEPFTSDLIAAGIEQTGDPVTRWGSGDPRLLALTFQHLAKDGYDDETRASIARHFETKAKAAVAHWNQVLALYLNAAGEQERDVLAGALALLARSEHVTELMNLVENASLGTSRIFFLRPINRLRREAGKEFVARFVNDSVLGKEAKAIMKGRSTSA